VDRPNVLKARIVDERNPQKAVVCHFNPKDLTVSRTIKWEEKTNIGNNAANLSFGGGKADDLTVPLLFDSTATGEDVRKSYQMLIDLANIDPQKKNTTTSMGEPPYCRFEWGRFLSFTAAITKLTQKFIMFKADGTPVRAEVSVTLKQVEKKPKPQNPTSRSETRKIWVVHEGQTLDWIAYQEYGNPAYWRHIAETNDLADPKELHPGQVLKLTPLP
jgi:hypothetical protein